MNNIRLQSRFSAKIFPKLCWLVLFLAGCLLPVFADSYLLRASSVFYINLLLAVGLSLIVNYAGLLNLGFMAFFAVGAYTYALLNTYTGLSFFLTLPLGMVAASVFSILLGFPTLRVRGDYLALVTLGFGEIVRILLLNIWGPHGIAGIKPPLAVATVGSVDNLYLLFYAVAFLPIPLALWLLSRIDRSKLANTWFAIRDNETAAKSCGIDSVKWLLLAFALGTAFAGVAGVIFAGVQRYVSPGSFVLDESIFILSIVVLAGGRSLWRLILAAGILSFLPEALRGLADYRMLIYGALLSAFVVGEERLKKLFECNRRRGRKQASTSSIHFDDTKPIPECLRRKVAHSDWTLSVKGLTMQFGGITAIDNISFSLQLGARTAALIGPNGAGKTTLFNCISGLYQPTTGEVRFPGVISPYTPTQSARAGVGRTFQTPQLFHSMTVRDNIAAGVLHKERGTQITSVVTGIIGYLGLDSVADQSVSQLSLGFQRLTEFARALALIPNVILLDEIASGLNSGEKEHMASIIQRLSHESGLGFLIIEHDMDFVLPLASEVIVLDSGKIIASGSPQDVTKNPLVIDAYMGKADAVA